MTQRFWKRELSVQCEVFRTFNIQYSFFLKFSMSKLSNLQAWPPSRIQNLECWCPFCCVAFSPKDPLRHVHCIAYYQLPAGNHGTLCNTTYSCTRLLYFLQYLHAWSIASPVFSTNLFVRGNVLSQETSSGREILRLIYFMYKGMLTVFDISALPRILLSTMHL